VKGRSPFPPEASGFSAVAVPIKNSFPPFQRKQGGEVVFLCPQGIKSNTPKQFPTTERVTVRSLCRPA